MKLENIIYQKPGKTIYRDGDRCYKVFGENFSKPIILNEALNQARVELTGINIPKVLEVTSIDGCWTIVSEYIEGSTLSELMAKNPDKHDEYLDRFIDIQLDILGRNCPLLSRLKDKMNGKVSQTKLNATVRYDLHTRIDSMPKQNCLCHGDFNPANVIMREDGEAYIIDWAHATQGNASADAARTYLLFCLAGDRETADKYLRIYCEKSDTDIQDVQKWMPIVAASQSVKGIESEQEFLSSWINVVDYV